MTEQQTIQHLSGMKPVECKCNVCVNMCHTASCLGTPDDILLLINNGHQAKLERTLWLAGIKYGLPPIEMVQPTFDDTNSKCVFLTEQNLCFLHDLGLKPTEGKLADCSKKTMPSGKYPPAWIIAFAWISDDNKETIAKINNAMQKYSGKK